MEASDVGGKRKPPTTVDGDERTTWGRRALRNDRYPCGVGRHRTMIPAGGPRARTGCPCATPTLWAMANPHELSQAAYDRLVAELEELRTHGRIEMADRIERAREHGDLKENAEYHAAKEEKAKMEGRIAKLFAILEDAVIVDSSGAEEARAGSIVTLKYDGDDDDEAERYLIGSIEERHPEVDHVVSPSSPLGEQLVGARVGDTVTYESPAGAQTVVVLGIE